MAVSDLDTPVPWTKYANGLLERFLENALDDKRQAELVRVHREGWRLVADAIGKGLSEIADAIRKQGR